MSLSYVQKIENVYNLQVLIVNHAWNFKDPNLIPGVTFIHFFA